MVTAPLRVLVACERSGVVRRAFRTLGHDAWSNDLEPADDRSVFHLQGDAREAIRRGPWDLLIAHPDCTYHVVSGARWFHETPRRPRAGVRYQADRYQARELARAFVRELWTAPIARVALENPIGTLAELLGPPTQIVQPHYFGDAAIKTTCLWLRGLPPLLDTDYRRPPADPAARRVWQECWREPSGPHQRQNRARTYDGIGWAMAAQWGEPHAGRLF